MALAAPIEPRQALGAAPAGDDAQVALRLAEPGAIRRDADVAGHRQLLAAPQGHRVDGRDDRLGALFDLVEDVLPQLDEFQGLVSILHRADLVDVGARHERELPRAGEDDHLNLIVSDQLAHRRVQVEQGGAVERVGRRMVDRQDGDTVLDGNANVGVFWHENLLSIGMLRD